jgi:Zn-dependent protease with chaperone function
MPIAAEYFDGQSLKAHPALVELSPEQLTLDYAQQRKQYALTDKPIVEWHAPRLCITFADQTQLVISNPPSAWLQQLQTDRLERYIHQGRQLRVYWCLLLGIFALTLYTTVKWTIPLLTHASMAIIPTDYLDRFSQKISASAIKQIGEPSNLCESVQSTVRSTIEQQFLPDQHSQTLPISLHFRAGLGVNALALPDGSIILTDDLLYFVSSAQELYGIVAHEIGHVRERHSLHMLIQHSLLTFFWDAITGDLNSTAAFASTLPLVLQSTAYSRQFERAADDYAMALLQQKNIDTRYLANFFIRISEETAPQFKDKLKQAELSKHCEQSRSLEAIMASNLIINGDSKPADNAKPNDQAIDQHDSPLKRLIQMISTHPSDDERIQRILSQAQ